MTSMEAVNPELVELARLSENDLENLADFN